MKHNISARGILERDGKILFVCYRDKKGLLYALPGGSQNVGEDLKSTVIREFREETCLDIIPHEVVLVREFTIAESEFEVWKDGIHQVEIIFRCSQTDNNQRASLGDEHDAGMYSVNWFGESDIQNLRVFPTKDIFKILREGRLTYLLN